jgi:reverse transcriptase-like protein/integrase-like protein
LTKKQQQWSWIEEEQASFDMLKDLCSSYPILQSPDWTKQFFMDTDALDFTLGAVISQEFNDGRHPITFHSRTLLPAEQNYDVHDKEMAAIIYRFKCGCPYFLGANHPIAVRTDHKNLRYFCQPQKITGRQARWMKFLQDFDFVLEHIPGHANTVANLLSHRKDLNKGVDSHTRTLLPLSLFLCHILKLDTTHKIYLEDDLEKRRAVLQELHSSPSAGHPGIANTWALVSRHYEGPQLCTFMEQYVRGCPYCQESKTNIPRKRVPLQQFDTYIDHGPFQYVSMDLITNLPVSEGYDSMLTIVDQGCFKAAKFLPCQKTIDGPGVARLYLMHLVPLFGLSKQIISDQDPRFASQFATMLCKALGIQQNLLTTFHPRMDGQTEQMNAWLEQYLRPWCTSHPRGWAQLLLIAEYAHNSWMHDMLKAMPHELVMGIKPLVNIGLILEQVPAAQE